MAKKLSGAETSGAPVAAVYDCRSPSDASPRRSQTAATKPAKPSALLDTRVVYCGDNLEQLGPCRTGHHWGETKEQRAFEDRHENTKALLGAPET
jgi:hypothetical protein